MTSICRSVWGLLLLAGILLAACNQNGRKEHTGASAATAPALHQIQGVFTLRDRANSSGIHVFLGGTNYSAWTDGAGRYTISDIKPGDYELIASKEGYSDYSAPLNLTGPFAGPTTLGIAELAPIATSQPAFAMASRPTTATRPVALSTTRPSASQPVRAIAGTITLLDVEGNPIEDYSGVTAFIDELNLAARVRNDGSFSFRNLPARALTVTAQAPDYMLESPQVVDLRTGALASAALTMIYLPMQAAPTGGTVSGTILTPQNAAAPKSIQVSLPGTQFTGTTDASGGFAFNDVPEGTYSFSAQAQGFLPLTLPEVVVAGGQVTDIGEQTLEQEVIAPKVVEIKPANGTRRVLIQARMPISIRFSKAMDRQSTKAAFSISPKVDYQIFMGNESSNSSENTLYVEVLGTAPQNFPRFMSTYTINIAQSATDANGTPLEKAFRSTFTTGGPTVSGSYPPNEMRDAPVDYNRSVVFYLNDQIAPGTQIENFIRIRPALDAAPRVQFTNDQFSGWSEVRVFGIWKPQTAYQVTLNRGLQNVDGQRYENLPYSIMFTTPALKTLAPLQIEPRRRIRPTR
mgnify:CR=1 FL=1